MVTEDEADYIWDFILLWGDDTEFKVPEGWELVEMDESNFGDYLPYVEPVIAQIDTFNFVINVKEEMEGGKLKFIRRRPEDDLEQAVMKLKDTDGWFYIESTVGKDQVLATTDDAKLQLEKMDEIAPQTKPNQIWKWVNMRKPKNVLRDGTGRCLNVKDGSKGAGSKMSAWPGKTYDACTFMFVKVDEDKFLVFGTGISGRQTALTVSEGSDPLTVTLEEPAPPGSEMRGRQTWRIISYDLKLKLVETEEIMTHKDDGWRLAKHKEVVAGGPYHFDMRAVMSDTQYVQAALADGSQGGPDRYETKEEEPGAEFGHALLMQT